MLSYRPPKSSLWGHRVGRLSSKQILELSLKFLREQTVFVDPGQDGMLNISWVPDRVDVPCELLHSLSDCVAAVPETGESKDFDGVTTRYMERKLWFEELPAVARWLDQLYDAFQVEQIQACSSVYLDFRWKRVSGGVSDLIRPDGNFGIHLGCIRAVTTGFTFDSMEHYEQIKSYLHDIGLVTLSDKHLKQK